MHPDSRKRDTGLDAALGIVLSSFGRQPRFRAIAALAQPAVALGARQPAASIRDPSGGTVNAPAGTDIKS